MSGNVTNNLPYFFLSFLLINFLFLSNMSLVNPDDFENYPLVKISPMYTVVAPL